MTNHSQTKRKNNKYYTVIYVDGAGVKKWAKVRARSLREAQTSFTTSQGDGTYFRVLEWYL